MRISDWSSDVCSSDLLAVGAVTRTQVTKRASIDDEIAGVRTGGAHRTDDAAVLKTDDLKVAAADRGGSGIVAGATCEPLDPCSVFDQVARAMNGPGKLRCIGRRNYCRSEERRGGKEWVSTCRSGG